MKRERALWSVRKGSHGYRVTVAERVFGGSVYLLTYDASLGGRRKESLRFRVRDERGYLIAERCERAEREALARVDLLRAGERPGAAVRLGPVLARFERVVVSHQGKRHHVENRRECELWRNYLGDSYLLAKLDVETWEAFIRDRRSGRIDGRGIVVPEKERRPTKSRTVAKSLKLLRQLCLWAVSKQLLRSDPTGGEGFVIPAEQNPARPVADSRRFEALLRAAGKVGMYGRKHAKLPSHFRTLLILANDTGRRISAIRQLRWSDWAPDVGQHGAITWRAAHDKLGRTTQVPVTRRVREALEVHRSAHPALGDVPVFAHPLHPGRPVTEAMVNRWLIVAEQHAKLAHLPGGGWHAFRRGWATSRKHLPVKDVAEAGGWKDTATLLECYQHSDPETLDAVVNAGKPVRLSR